MFDLSIYIPVSRSPVYNDVINNATITGLYTPETHLLTFGSLVDVFRWWEQFSFVVWSAQKWTGFSIRVNDHILLPYSNKVYYWIQDVRRCWYAYNKNTYKSEYCTDNFFGCHRLQSIFRHPNPSNWDHQCWWRYGRFINSTTYKIDKRAIYNQLIAEAKECFAFHCPQFSARRVKAEVAKLPDTIELNDYWTVDYRATVGKDGPEVLACGIRYNWNVPDGTLLEAPPICKPDSKATEQEINRYLDDFLKQKKRG